MLMDYQIELRHLKYFLAVAEHLHFRKAADSLFISQPGLSRQIKYLERELDVDLFNRHNRSVELTPSGLYLKTELNTILNNLEDSFTQVKLLNKGFIGNLRFGYVGSAIQDVIPKILIRIRKEYPKILFDLKEMDNQKQVDRILNNEIDFGFVRMDNVPRDLNKLAVYEDTFSLVLPKTHSVNAQNFKSLYQLREEPFILFDSSYSQSYYQKVMKLFDESGFTPLISHNTVHANTIYRLVENNFGLSIVPSSLKKGYNMNIKFIELSYSKLRTTLRLIWNKENKNPLVNNILELIDKS